MEKVALYVQALDLSKTWLEKKVENPETGRMVKVKSLPPELQKQYRPKSHEKAIQHQEKQNLKETNKKIDFHKNHALHHFDQVKKHYNKMEHMKKHHDWVNDEDVGEQKFAETAEKYNHHLEKMKSHINHVLKHHPDHEANYGEVENNIDWSKAGKPVNGPLRHNVEALGKLHKQMKNFKTENHKIKKED